MRRTLASLACVIFLLSALQNAGVSAEIARSSDESPTDLIGALGDSVVRILKNDSLAHQDRIEQFDNLRPR